MSGKRYKDNNDDINDKKDKINREREDKYRLKIDDENDNIENKRIAYKKRAYSVIEEQSIHHDDNYERDNNYKGKVSEKKLESDCEKDIDTERLTKKRKLQEDNIEVEVLLVDATECEIERPKKNKKVGTQEKRKNIQ